MSGRTYFRNNNIYKVCAVPVFALVSGYLEHPHYTRPEVFVVGGKKYRVPKVLLGGHHKEIAAWRVKA